MENSTKGKFINDCLEVSSLVRDNYMILTHQGKNLISIQLKQIEAILNKLNKNVIISELEASLSVSADFEIELSSPYSYGEDIDGNRGVIRPDYENVIDSSFEFKEIKLFLHTEEGFNLNPHDSYFMDLDYLINSTESNELKDLIIDLVNQSPDSFARD